jgi:predicted DsbA family dithiol-disulfide isomerase
MPKKLTVEIVSDFACPWCFVGKRRLEEAMSLRPELEIELTWTPFQLNPDMPREGLNRRDYYRDKFGEEKLSGLREHLNHAGEAEGIVFCDDPDAMAPNTLSAHTLMYWAANDKNVDVHSLSEKLLIAHHVDCENIGCHEVLGRIAEEVGMDKTSVMSKLYAGENEDQVKTQIQQSAARGISGVPFFILNETFSLSGAQPTGSFVEAFDQLADQSL